MINLFFRLFLSGFLTIFLSSCGQSQTDYELRKLQKNLSREISQELQIVTVADSVGMPSGVLKKFGFNFYCYRPLSEREAIELLLKSAEMVVSGVNKNEYLLSKTVDGIFDIKNVQNSIFLADKRPYGNAYPDLSVISIESSIVTFLKIKEDENGKVSIGSVERIPLEELMGK